MRINVTTPVERRVSIRRHVDYVGDRIAEVMPAVFAWQDGGSELDELTLDARLAELEHAVRLTRNRLMDWRQGL